MSDHSAKGHSTWSASSTNRNWNCPGALALTLQVEHLNDETEAAGWGTACHKISEQCLVDGHDAVEFIDRIVTTQKHSFVVDEEMAETAQTYVDYVRERLASEPDAVLYVEQRFSLDKLKPPFDAGGTADAVIHFPSLKLLEVIDLKGGFGLVEATGNPQLRTYGTGAVLANPDLEVETVKTTIVQPRARHKDGKIRSETLHVSDLIEWTTDLVDVMRKSKTAQDAYAATTCDLTREAWAETYLNAGDHCTFCPAAGFCPKLEKRAMDAAGVWFDDLSNPQLRNTPSELSPERLAQVLDAADMVEDWLKACRRLAHTLAEDGTEIPNYALEETKGRRKWIGDDEKELANDLLLKTKLDKEFLYNDPKLKSPAQLEKVLGGRRKTEIAEFITTPVTGTKLVRADKIVGAAVQPGALRHFDIIE